MHPYCTEPDARPHRHATWPIYNIVLLLHDYSGRRRRDKMRFAPPEYCNDIQALRRHAILRSRQNSAGKTLRYFHAKMLGIIWRMSYVAHQGINISCSLSFDAHNAFDICQSAGSGFLILPSKGAAAASLAARRNNGSVSFSLCYHAITSYKVNIIIDILLMLL